MSLISLILTSALLPAASAQPLAPRGGLWAGSYLVYSIDEVAFHSTPLHAMDRYLFRGIAENGSITAEINWGVAGTPETPTETLSGLQPLNPADPQLNTLTVLIKTDVPDGTYRFGRSVTRISRGLYEHGRTTLPVIISQHVVYTRSSSPTIQYNGTHYYERSTGVLLHAVYRYGPPTYTKGTMDLVKTNVFNLEPPSTPWWALVLGLTIVVGVLVNGILTARKSETLNGAAGGI